MNRASGNVNPEDRLFHLILALLSTSFGLTKNQILHSVRGYREDTEAGVVRESLERRFERDKDALRDLGIPLEVTIPAADDGNNKNSLYRIPKGDYDLPEDIEFTPRDVALLNLSAALWREGSLSHEARIAQVKLASFGVTMTESLVGYAPIISTRDPALARVRDAIEANVTIGFEYLKPGDSHATSRVVSPWALVNHEGRWHLHAHETSSDKAKTFLLRRIVSPVTLLTTPAAPASEDVAQRAIEGLEEVYQRQVATLVVVAPSDAWSILCAKRNTQASGDTLEVHYTDLDIFANELAALGNDVVVHSPAALVDAVVANLRMLVDHHGG